jgi:hypothetical protein
MRLSRPQRMIMAVIVKRLSRQTNKHLRNRRQLMMAATVKNKTTAAPLQPTPPSRMNNAMTSETIDAMTNRTTSATIPTTAAATGRPSRQKMINAKLLQ